MGTGGEDIKWCTAANDTLWLLFSCTIPRCPLPCPQLQPLYHRTLCDTVSYFNKIIRVNGSPKKIAQSSLINVTASNVSPGPLHMYSGSSITQKQQHLVTGCPCESVCTLIYNHISGARHSDQFSWQMDWHIIRPSSDFDIRL